MKRLIQPAIVALGAAVLVGTAWFAYQLSHPPGLDPYAEQWLPPTDPATAPLRVTSYGVATLLMDDGETAIMTDGFFTRPDKWTVLTGRIAPDVPTITATLQHSNLSRLAAVLVTHSHYDHAMDAPAVAQQTGALVVGSESTAHIARGWGLAEERIRVVRPDETLTLGRFRVTFLRTQHAPTLFTGGTITAPLTPPVHANRYQEGGSFALLVEHDGRTLLVHSSAGYVEAALQGRKADVVFLGVGTLGIRDESYRQAYWHEVVTRVGARRVIPIHWDDFFVPLDQPMRPLPRPFDDFAGTMRFLKEEGARSGIDIRLAPPGVAVDPFAGLDSPSGSYRSSD